MWTTLAVAVPVHATSKLATHPAAQADVVMMSGFLLMVIAIASLRVATYHRRGKVAETICLGLGAVYAAMLGGWPLSVLLFAIALRRWLPRSADEQDQSAAGHGNPADHRRRLASVPDTETRISRMFGHA